MVRPPFAASPALPNDPPRSFAAGFDAHGDWRAALGRRLDELGRFLADHDLADGATGTQLGLLRERIAQDRLVVAFVAEFSRGKSELINAIFFADAGRRILPATPGRTTMCPVELAWDAEEEPALALLPIETRLEGASLGELRGQPRAWTRIPLAVNDPALLAETLREVTRTRHATKDDARALGFWDDARPDDNPPLDEHGRAEVPAWRHALINYPHPLLRQGLVVLDTPGLNAIGAEPELTLGLLPTAHAIVFVLGADTGVTKSDLEIWRDHLGDQGSSRFVVLNKIDALADPLATAAQVRAQIERQRRETARTLGVDADHVFPLSARQALAARVDGDAAALAASRLPALEEALGRELLPRRAAVLEAAVRDAAQRVEAQVARRLGDMRRQLAEQMLELRGLRGKSSAKVRMMLERVGAETAEFEQCTARLQAMRLVHMRMLRELNAGLSGASLSGEISSAQEAMTATLLNLGARKAFVALCARLRSRLAEADQRGREIHDMLEASFAKLNAEFGFSLSLGAAPSLAKFQDELALIESSYVRYLGLGHALRLSQPRFMEQFRRMLTSKLRVVFENALGEVELWNKASSQQLESQLRERRRGFRRRRDALERIETAAGELDQRLAELEAQDGRLGEFHARTMELTNGLCEHAEMPPAAAGAPGVTIDLPLESGPSPSVRRVAAAG